MRRSIFAALLASLMVMGPAGAVAAASYGHPPMLSAARAHQGSPVGAGPPAHPGPPTQQGPPACRPSASESCLAATDSAALVGALRLGDVGLLSLVIEHVRDDDGRVRAIRITIRVWDPKTEQARQITVVQDL